jgi:TonB family protein
MDAVSQILVDRTREADKFSRMVLVSLVAHAAIVTAVTLMPSTWDTVPQEREVMVISLGGPPGPIQGRNPIPGRPVDEAVPETVKPRVDTAPSPAKPEMVLPTKAAKPEPKPTKTKADPEPTRSKPPSQGAEVKQGAARADTQGAPIPWGGLATGGGGDGGVTTDIANFCCPEYLQILKRSIYANWKKQQGQPGLNVVRFVIKRDGTISDVIVEKSAGQFLDIASQRAVVQTQRLPPLPAAFTLPTLTVHLEFEYTR